MSSIKVGKFSFRFHHPTGDEILFVRAEERSMKTVYVAGPYRARTKLGVLLNILRARKVAKKLWRAGFAVFCPHMNSALMDGVCPDKNFLDADVLFLAQCDIMVLMPRWEWSKGCQSEYSYAIKKGIRVWEWEHICKNY